jgi:hypothetical protein
MRSRGQTFTEAERLYYRDEVFKRHAARMNNDAIARELDISADTVAKLIRDAYKEISLPLIEEALRKDLELIEQTILIASDKYKETKDPRDYDALHKMLEFRAKLLGTAAPEKHQVMVTEVTQEDIAILEFMNEEKAKNSNVENELKDLLNGS